MWTVPVRLCMVWFVQLVRVLASRRDQQWLNSVRESVMTPLERNAWLRVPSVLRADERQSLRRLWDGRVAAEYIAPRPHFETALGQLAEKATCLKNRVAVCVIGQLSRLEVGTKLANLFDSLALGRGKEAVSFFPILEIGGDYMINSETMMSADHSCHSDVISERDVAMDFSGYYKRGLFIAHEEYVPHLEHWGTAYANEEGKCGLNRSKRIGGNVQQFSHIASCAALVQKDEKASGCFYDYVVRVRDNSVIVQPFTVEPTETVLAKACASWGGINDKAMIVPRSYLQKAFEEPFRLMQAIEQGKAWATELVSTLKNSESLLLAALSQHSVPVTQDDSKFPVVDGRCLGLAPAGGFDRRAFCVVPDWKDCRPANMPEGFNVCDFPL